VTIALRIDPEDQTVDPGRQAVFTVHVVNQSGVVDRVALDILGPAGAWSSVEPQAVALFPGTDATATVVITPPVGTPLGPVPIGVRATAETSGFVEVGEANLNVGASRSVEAELRPRTATGKRRATSVVVLHNVGNAPTKVQVVATDPDDAIVFDALAAVQIGPGMTAEVPLRMRLPSREKQGATLPYQVLVEGGETGQSLDGQVRQPAKKRWPLVAALMLAALLVAAFVLLKPQDSKAISAGKADEPTSTTVAGATTTVVGATTTIAGAPNPGGGPAAPGAPVPGSPAQGGPAAAAAATPGAVAPKTPVVNGPSGGVVPNRPTLGNTTTTTAPCPPPSSWPSPGPSIVPAVTNVPKNSRQVVVDTRGVRDANGDPLVIVISGIDRPPVHGTASIGDGNRTITYAPVTGYVGPDQFTYSVSDGSGGVATATQPLCVQG